ncbi:MAG: hypothetical protein IJT73_08235 [Selenomonadaceae bacterium]|nr:hypothetical protein [Selenomonadaceae bacterium]
MVKMILAVPHNFNAEYFCHLATTMLNVDRQHCDKTDYDLGDFVTARLSQTPYFDEYEIGAELIDFETIDVISKLQELCPLVNIHFENDGSKDAPADVYGEDYFDEAYYYLFKYAGTHTA